LMSARALISTCFCTLTVMDQLSFLGCCHRQDFELALELRAEQEVQW
jgi:hypothetical protein